MKVVTLRRGNVETIKSAFIYRWLGMTAWLAPFETKQVRRQIRHIAPDVEFYKTFESISQRPIPLGLRLRHTT